MPTSRQWIALAAACTTVAALLMLPGLLSGPNFDASVFLLIGDRLLDGDLPYVDLWDHKPPGIYLIDATVVALLGWAVGPWPAVWIGSVAATASIGLAVVGAGSRRWGFWPSAGAAILATAFAASWPLSLGGGLTETFAAAFLGLAAWVAVSRRAAVAWAGAGALLALAVATSLFAGPAAATVVLLLAVSFGARPALIAVGSATVVGVVGIGAAAALGMLPAMIDALFSYNAAYRASLQMAAPPDAAATSAGLVAWYSLHAALLLGTAMVGAVAGRKYLLARGALLSIAGTGAMIGIGGRLYGHYLILIAPSLGFLAAFGLHRVGEWAAGGARRTAAIAALGILLVLSVSTGYEAYVGRDPFAAAARGLEREVADVLREHGYEGQRLLVWGNSPIIYLRSGMDPAWRYIYLWPLLTAGYVTAGMVEDVVDRLVAVPPCYVVDAGSRAPGEPGLPPLLIDRPLAPSERSEDRLDPVRAFVRANYKRMAETGWPIYQLVRRCD